MAFARTTSNRHATPRMETEMDCSARADGQRAFQLGYPITSCPYRGSHRNKIADWERGWKEQQANALPRFH